jgi:hypothetical protein
MELEVTVPQGFPAVITPAVPPWRDILLREVAGDKRGKAGVATRLGVSRSYVSRVLSSGSSAYAEVPREFILRVLDLESEIVCPAAANTKRPRADCHKANTPAPTHNPLAMRTWRECQSCANKPAQEIKP